MAGTIDSAVTRKQDEEVDKDAKSVSFVNIPPAFRAEIDKRKKEIKDSPYGRLLGGIGMHG